MKNEVDPIVCGRAFVVSPDISEFDFTAVAMLLARYTSLAGAGYRLKNERDYPEKSNLVRKALNAFHKAVADFFNKKYSASYRSLAPNNYKVATGVITANLTEADIFFADNDYSQCIIHLETALTTLHNFIYQILDAIET